MVTWWRQHRFVPGGQVPTGTGTGTGTGKGTGTGTVYLPEFLLRSVPEDCQGEVWTENS